MDSHVIIRNNTERPCIPFTQIPPVLTPCTAVLQGHSQDLQRDTVRMQNIPVGIPVQPHPFCSHPRPLLNP